MNFQHCARGLATMFCICGTMALTQTSTIVVSSQPIRTSVERFGINLSGQTFYDSGQMLRNLVFRNPGFEGETWQSILRCKAVTSDSCTDENQYAVWPANFLAGAKYEVLSGPAAGTSGVVASSSPVHPPAGVTLSFATENPHLAAGDFILVRAEKPGDATAGWWTSTDGGATLATEFRDLSPRTPGRQALRIEASAAGQSASVSSYFDTLAGHSFVQLHGLYRLRFRAKPLSDGGQMQVRLERLDTTHGLEPLLHRTVRLKPGWNDYALNISANENGSSIGNVALTFAVQHSSLLLDDVDLEPATRPASNPTAFRDAVVEALRELHPGVLRFMDNGTGFGSSLDNLLAPPLARRRAGASTQETRREDLPIGLHEFLTLCKAVGAEPWFSLPPGLSPEEARNLVEYLSAPPSTHYGSQRAKLGQAKPWSEVFPVIHLELGNEQWNAHDFAGSAISDPTIYAHRAALVFSSARSSPYFRSDHFDLVLGSWFAVPWWTHQELAAAGTSIDSVAVAPYLFAEFNTAPNVEAVFGPMFAQPEQIDSKPDGLMALQARETRTAAHPVRLNVYETNLGTMSGSVAQSAIDSTVPSLGGGLAVADHMLLMLRDVGVTAQCLFALPQYRNNFTSTNGAKQTMPLWGAVVDMGGATNRRRPTFFALEMMNEAILPTMLATRMDGADPTWQQPPSPNDHITLDAAHELQTFTFADGTRRSLIVLNLSRTESLNVNFAGPYAPLGQVHRKLLTAAHITDSNEDLERVKPVESVVAHFNPGEAQLLPPHSMTVLTWTVAP